MQDALIGIAVLACPLGMGAMMWFMAKGMRKEDPHRETSVAPSLERLREEHQRLGEQIERRQDGERTGAG